VISVVVHNIFTCFVQSGTGGDAEYKPLPSGPSNDEQKEPEVSAISEAGIIFLV
jgi:hypothetical protein